MEFFPELRDVDAKTQLIWGVLAHIVSESYISLRSFSNLRSSCRFFRRSRWSASRKFHAARRMWEEDWLMRPPLYFSGGHIDLALFLRHIDEDEKLRVFKLICDLDPRAEFMWKV